MRKRIEWIDIAKYVAIMFVMLSHFEECPDIFRDLFTPFYLAVFFFCSGYCYRLNGSFKEMFAKKVKQLFIPWLVYSNLNIIISNIKSFKEHENGLFVELFRNMLQIRYFDERLWFIPALFTAFIPFYFVVRSYEKDKSSKKSILILCFVLSLGRAIYKEYMNPDFFPWHLTSLPWHIDYIPTAMLFMVLGYLFKKEWEESFDGFNTMPNRVMLTVAYLFVVYFMYFNGNNYGNYVIEFVYDHLRHFLGIATVIAWCKVSRINRYVAFVGANTLLYFCIHNKVVTLFEVVTRRFLPALNSAITSSALHSSLFCIIMTIIISLVLIVPAIFVNKYLPWTVGKRRSS